MSAITNKKIIGINPGGWERYSQASCIRKALVPLMTHGINNLPIKHQSNNI